MSSTVTTRRPVAEAVGIVAVVLLLAAAMAVPEVLDWNVHVNFFPPVHAEWLPRTGPGTLPALVLGALACWRGVSVAESLTWGRLLLLAYAAGLAWMLALASVDGRDGIGEILQYKYEYLPTARQVDDLPAILDEYTSRIPFSAGDQRWPPHLAGHPPGALTFYVVLVRLGLGGGFAAGIVTTLLAATTALAVLVTLRTLGAEQMGRRAAPFLVIGPAAIWQCVSADGMFAAFAAWGLACLAMASVRRSLVWSVPAGLLLGWAVMMSYGLPLLGILALVVLWLGGSWKPLLPTASAALVVVLAFAAFGFQWWEAIGVLHDRYWDGIARKRPATYWLWGNLAALAFCTGPMVAAGLARAAASARELWADRQSRVALALTGAGAAIIATADLSRMSKGEVERIWLPFAPWLLISTAFVPRRWRTVGVAVQVVFALVVQHLLRPDW